MLNKTLSKKLNFIEIYQFFGGLVGLLLTIYLLLTTNPGKYQNPFFIPLILPFVFFGLSIYSAWLLNKKKYLKGLNLLIILLFLQMIAFEFYGLYYTSVSGIAINFTLDLTNDTFAGFDFQPSQFFLTFNASDEVFRFKLNLFAFGMLFFVSKTIRELKSSLYSIV
ncbi:hypothetical protein [Flavobacterium sp. LC2016-01]|uniref:hypothetical protein n=1 Tax=Flavobacterium sp. LC2016-01 TaxID=2675876 RepID=UPI0012BA990E|nr:hypothetical protein [Flavobacterium sp. LC2016-01]MTH16661.1 hypothetical protein [Flavobacterium sp. LC2016-01]